MMSSDHLNQHQLKNGYKFTINDRSSFYDWYNAYFEVQFQLQKLADGAGYVAAYRITIINGVHLQRIYWGILMITADQLQKTVYGI